ncbi:MAG: hypothetical protein JST68_03275, partial [Bacteroidetes bacterium]|nr:hypothetical protein [Bacteroidota bacterium]
MKKTISILSFCLAAAVNVTNAQNPTNRPAQTPEQTPAKNKPSDSLKLFLQPVEVRALRAGEKAPFTKTDINK